MEDIINEDVKDTGVTEEVTLEQPEEDNTGVIREALTSMHGHVAKDWEVVLMMLEDALHRYKQIKKQIDKDGVMPNDKRHDLLSIEKDLSTLIMRYLQKLGASPLDIGKIKSISEEDTDDFLMNLIK